MLRPRSPQYRQILGLPACLPRNGHRTAATSTVPPSPPSRTRVRLHVTGSRRLSQAISEGEGISVIATVSDAASAREAESAGADGLFLREAARDVRDATALPILFRGDGNP